MMAKLRILFRYIGSLATQGFFSVLLFLDMVGAVLVYTGLANIPHWLLWLLPSLALFVASFRLYCRGAADIILQFDSTDASCVFAGGHGSLTQCFAFTVGGHLTNFGPQTGVLQKFACTVSLNGVQDPVFVHGAGFHFTVTSLLDGKVPGHTISLESEKKHALTIPSAIPSGHVQPVTLGIRLYIDAHEQARIEERVRWVRSIEIGVEYVTRVSEHSYTTRTAFQIASSLIAPAIASGKDHHAKINKLIERAS